MSFGLTSDAEARAPTPLRMSKTRVIRSGHLRATEAVRRPNQDSTRPAIRNCMPNFRSADMATGDKRAHGASGRASSVERRSARVTPAEHKKPDDTLSVVSATRAAIGGRRRERRRPTGRRRRRYGERTGAEFAINRMQQPTPPWGDLNGTFAHQTARYPCAHQAWNFSPRIQNSWRPIAEAGCLPVTGLYFHNACGGTRA